MTNLNRFFNAFNKYYRQQSKIINCSVEYNNLVQLNKTIIDIKRIYDLSVLEGISYWKAIVKLGLNHFKSTFYSYLDKITLWFKTKKFNGLLLKSKRPKKIHYKYNEKFRKGVCNQYYDEYWPIQTIFYHLRKTKEYEFISMKTIIKMIWDDPRNDREKKIKKVIKHPLRHYNLAFGNLQMDLKIVGRKQSPTGKPIIIFDAKDEQSKLLYMQLIRSQTMESLLQAVRNMIDYFRTNFNMKILRIRTDNAMVFKSNNFVHSENYANLLNKHNIEKQHIPLGQPECNGVIERHHETLDKELIKQIGKFDSYETIAKKIANYMHFHNFERAHQYKFLEKVKGYETFASRLFIPVDFYNMSVELNQNTPKNPL